MARAVNYLYTQETKSSYAIEGEAPSGGRSERFVAALANAESFNPLDIAEFVRLQNAIVDPRYGQAGWRTGQNYVSGTKSDFSEHVYYAGPKPEHVASLMEGWMQMVFRLKQSAIDPVFAAAAASFGFVFNHPFEDGNGRIHRFLIHHMLASTKFAPGGLLFPVSAVMLRERREYDRVLNTFSSAIMPFITYQLDREGRMTVLNDTARLYRFWDATRFAEYLYSCVAETIRKDIGEEIGFLKAFDEALRKTAEIVDMPDRRAALLVKLILQNKGRLAGNRREQFAELRDDELLAIEAAIRESAVARGQPSA